VETRAGTEDDDPALLEVSLGAPRDVRLGDLGHRDRRLYPRRRSRLLEEVLQRQRVHHRAEHAHVVRPPTVHPALTELGTAEEVAPADDDRDLDVLRGVGDLPRQATHHLGTHAQGPGTEGLTRQLQQDPSSA
jgi:hypothetical protein